MLSASVCFFRKTPKLTVSRREGGTDHAPPAGLHPANPGGEAACLVLFWVTCAGCISRGPRRKQKVHEETPGRPGWTGSRETSKGVRPGRALGLLTLGSRSCPETRRQAGTWRGWLYIRPPAGAVARGARPRCPTVTQDGCGHGYPASTLPHLSTAGQMSQGATGHEGHRCSSCSDRAGQTREEGRPGGTKGRRPARGHREEATAGAPSLWKSPCLCRGSRS